MKKSKLYLRVICLCLMVCIFTLNNSVIALSKNLKNAEEYQNKPFIVKEDITKRGEFEKHFINSDGSYVAMSYPEQIHYKKDNEWVEVDNTLQEVTTENGTKRFANRGGLMDVSFSKTSADNLAYVEYDGYSISWGITAKQAEKVIEAPSGLIGFFNGLFGEENKSEIIPQKELSMNMSAEAEVKQTETKDLKKEQIKTIAQKSTSKIQYKSAFDNIDVNYTVSPSRVKEDIVLQSRSDITEYIFNITANHLTAKLNDDKSIAFMDDSGAVKFIIMSPYMIDAKDNFSDNIDVTLEKNGENGYKVTIFPDTAWLNDDDRVYPVTIDPTVNANNSASNISDTYVRESSPNSNYYLEHHIKIGNYNGLNYNSGINVALVKFDTLPTLPSGSYVYSANMILTLVSGQGIAEPASAWFNTTSWAYNTVTWNNRPSAYEMTKNVYPQNLQYYNFNVTEAVNKWRSGSPNYGLSFVYYNISTPNLNSFYSSNSGIALPSLTITYDFIPPLEEGVYYIRNLNSGKYLDLYNKIAQNGQRISVWGFTGDINQKWYVKKESNGLSQRGSDGGLPAGSAERRHGHDIRRQAYA